MTAAVFKIVLFLLVNGYFPDGPVSRPLKNFEKSFAVQVYFIQLPKQSNELASTRKATKRHF